MLTRLLNTRSLIVVFVLALAALAACSPASSSTGIYGSSPAATSAPAQAPTLAPVVAPTSAPIVQATTAPAAAPSSAPAQSAPAMASLKITENATLGKFVTDGAGRTLYLFLKDTKNTSNCYDACAQKWPPLISQDKPSLGDGISADLVGSTQRKDGSSQVTYNGWPLYYYAPDQQPADVKGQGIGSVWFVVTPSGDAMTGSSAAPTAPANAQNSAPSATQVDLKVTQNSALGQIVTDTKGRTLYLFMQDTPNTSNCYNGCAQKWPPLLSQGQLKLGDGIKPDLVGTTQRKDGTTQVTYSGWPLYYFAPDQQPGDVKGQGVGSVWFVITPAGQAFTGSAAPAAPAPAPTAAPTAASMDPSRY